MVYNDDNNVLYIISLFNILCLIFFVGLERSLSFVGENATEQTFSKVIILPFFSYLILLL